MVGDPRKSRNVGKGKELLAVEYLISQGVNIIQRNFFCRQGEIDLIGIDNDFLIFVEVRYRRNSSFGSPEETVNRKKQYRIIRSARHFLSHNTQLQHLPCRFDVIAIRNNSYYVGHSIRWLQDAFQPGPQW